MGDLELTDAVARSQTLADRPRSRPPPPDSAKPRAGGWRLWLGAVTDLSMLEAFRLQRGAPQSPHAFSHSLKSSLRTLAIFWNFLCLFKPFALLSRR